MCILTMKSMTFALRAKSVLDSRGISVSVVNLDPHLTERGCAYGIRFACGEQTKVKEILSERGIPFGMLIGIKE